MPIHVSTRPSSDPTPVRWLLDADLPGKGRGVGSFVPSGFEAYVRILHPAMVGSRLARWSEIAEWSGKAYHRAVDSSDLMVRRDGLGWEDLADRQRPAEGDRGLDPIGTASLHATLAAATQTPDRLWVLVDSGTYRIPRASGYRAPGRGGLWSRSKRRRKERRQEEEARALIDEYSIGLAGNRFLLHEGAFRHDAPTRAATPTSVGYCWPEDKAWLVHANADCPTTYVACTAALADDLLTSDALEVVEAHLTDPFDGHLG